MQNWMKFLNGDPIPWLLEPENPSVRYWTLVEILDRPADDLEVQEARSAIAQQPFVKELFALQHPEGYWGDETKPHTAQGAATVLNLLLMLGVPPDQRTAAGCDSFLRFCQHESGGFSMVKKLRSGIFPCTTGTHLRFLVYFGFGDDLRVQAAFNFLIEAMSAESALDCGRYQHQDCLWGAISALEGLAVPPTGTRRSVQSERTVQRLADTILNFQYDFRGEHKRWLTLGVPRAWDLLSALKALAAHGYTQDGRFTALLELLLSRQDEQGRWLCGSASRTWPIEKLNRPSKWVTLDAVRVLKQVGWN